VRLNTTRPDALRLRVLAGLTAVLVASLIAPASVTAANGPVSTSTVLEASPSSGTFGAEVVLEAQVVPDPAPGVAPQGTVTFSVISDDQVTVLGSSPVDDEGRASLATSVLPVGAHTIEASFEGDTVGGVVFDNSADTAEVVVERAPTSLHLSSSTNPSNFGQSVSVTAKLQWVAGAPLPSGEVTFSDGDDAIAVVEVDGNGRAMLESSSLEVGSHALEASYAGDTAYLESSASIEHVVDPATPTTSVGSPKRLLTVGEPATLHANVFGSAGAPRPTGTVQFLAGSTVLGEAELDDGIATITAPLALGGHDVAISYEGDDRYLPRRSQPLSHSVVTSRPGPRPNLRTDVTFNDGTDDVKGRDDCRTDVRAWGGTYGDRIRLATAIECAMRPLGPGMDPTWKGRRATISWGLDTDGQPGADYLAFFEGGPDGPVVTVVDVLNSPSERFRCFGTPGWDGAHVFSVEFHPSCVDTPASFGLVSGMVLYEGGLAGCFCTADVGPDNGYGIGTIRRPRLKVADASIRTGSRGKRSLRFTVTLDRKTVNTATVAWATRSGTAKARRDFRTASGTVTFKPGQTKKTVAVTVYGKPRTRDQTFTVRLTSPRNSTIARSSATGRLRR